ncbi:MAG: hypothetical protein LBU60_06555 [Clostridiales bacterium]|jgi:stage III sporulation protein AG|nr:hypothetical protein [Clostridiales bacterium]
MKEQKTTTKLKNSITAKLKQIKHIEFYIAGIAVGVMLLIYFSANLFGQAGASSPGPPTPPSASFADYHQRTESNLQRVVSSMKGVGKAEVAINWESSIELVIAYITVNNNGTISSTPQLVTENGVTKPIVLHEIYPKALGVVIVAQGGNDARVRLNIIEMTSVLLSISQDKVVVQSM